MHNSAVAVTNAHGAWIICGEMGFRPYYCTKKEDAIRQYKEDCRKKRNKPGDNNENDMSEMRVI